MSSAERYENVDTDAPETKCWIPGQSSELDEAVSLRAKARAVVSTLTLTQNAAPFTGLNGDHQEICPLGTCKGGLTWKRDLADVSLGPQEETVLD